MINNSPQSLSCTTETSENSITIGIASTSAEKREIYHFRYQIYVEEMFKPVEEVDYENQLLYDELDEWGFQLYAKIGSELIATVRINIGSLEEFPEKLIEIHCLNTFQKSFAVNGIQNFAHCSKLIIAPSQRSSMALYLLLAKSYDIFCRNEVQFAFACCNLYSLRLYEQMGFHRYGKNFTFPGYSLLTPIVLAVDDIQHLRMVRSPLFRIARKREAFNTKAVEWFYTRFTPYSHVINSQIVTEEKLWSILCTRLNSSPRKKINVLRHLSAAEAKKFLHRCGILVHCDSGDRITNQGDVSYTYNILISGRLESLTFQRPVKEYTVPGQSFGVNGLTEHNKHIEDIITIDSSEILVLSGMAFQKFFHTYPDIAHKIVQNIVSLTKSKQNLTRMEF